MSEHIVLLGLDIWNVLECNAGVDLGCLQWDRFSWLVPSYASTGRSEEARISIICDSMGLMIEALE